jgi:membrane fusion protein (multidrug efflux system)
MTPSSLARPVLVALIAAAGLAAAASAADSIEAEGLVLPFRDIKLSSQLEAKLHEVRAKEGDEVKEGAILAVLYSDLDRLERDRAAKVLERAQSVWDSNRRLSKDRIVSEEKALESRVAFEVAQIDLGRAEAMLEEKTIRAPWEGQVVRRFVEEGETVARAREIFQLVDYRQVFVIVYLEARHIRSVEAGSEARLSLPLLGYEDVPARVAFVDPVVDGSSGLFRVKLLVPNPERRIKPGVRAKVRFAGSPG